MYNAYISDKKWYVRKEKKREEKSFVQKVRTAIDALKEKTQTEKPENPDTNKPDNDN